MAVRHRRNQPGASRAIVESNALYSPRMANEAQGVLWDGGVGDAWVDNAATYDEMLAPFGEAAINRLEPTVGERVLDVGCGTGATSLAIAGRVAPGRVVGVDISARMVARAQQRAADASTGNVSFVTADVQTAELGAGVFDAAFSRMGVMFFADPVAAFANVAHALRPAGRLCFCCFQGLEANPGIVLPLLAVAEILSIAPPDLSGPSPFSLADIDLTTDVLHGAGFVNVQVDPGPDLVRLSGADDLRGIAGQLLVQNPLTCDGFTSADEVTREAALDAAVDVLAPHRRDDTLELNVATWIVSAHTPE